MAAGSKSEDPCYVCSLFTAGTLESLNTLVLPFLHVLYLEYVYRLLVNGGVEGIQGRFWRTRCGSHWIRSKLQSCPEKPVLSCHEAHFSIFSWLPVNDCWVAINFCQLCWLSVFTRLQELCHVSEWIQSLQGSVKKSCCQIYWLRMGTFVQLKAWCFSLWNGYLDSSLLVF